MVTYSFFIFFFFAADQTQLDIQGLKMTQLEIENDGLDGPYQCGETSSSSAEERATVDFETNGMELLKIVRHSRDQIWKWKVNL